MKTSELTGPLLDQWVARSLGMDTLPLEPGNWCWVYTKGGTAKEAFRPSQDWAHGGPLLEDRMRRGLLIKCWAPIARLEGSEKLEPFTCSNHTDESVPLAGGWDSDLSLEYGATPLIAFCRLLVAEKFGDEVPERE